MLFFGVEGLSAPAPLVRELFLPLSYRGRYKKLLFLLLSVFGRTSWREEENTRRTACNNRPSSGHEANMSGLRKWVHRSASSERVSKVADVEWYWAQRYISLSLSLCVVKTKPRRILHAVLCGHLGCLS